MTDIASLLKQSPPEHRLETELLIGSALGWNRAKVLGFDDTTLHTDVLDRLVPQLERLAEGEPYAYIVGSREFFGLEFSVTPAVLIPRPDTELLVELAISLCPEGARVVDLGTGSGAIAVSLKHARPDLTVSATDSSEDALAVARSNALRHQCDIAFFEGHWLDAVPFEVDVIVSNPPYIAPGDPHLDALGFEPHSALVAANDGMADIRSIASGASTTLSENGILLIEHGYNQASLVADVLHHYGYVDISLHKDLGNQPRVTTARRCGQSAGANP